MSKKIFSIERVVAITGFLFLLIAFISSFYVQPDENSILKYVTDTQTVVHIVHGVCAFLCFLLIFKPITVGFCFLMFVESILNILTTYEQLGIFFFYSYITLAITKGLFEKHTGTKIVVSFIVHFAAIILVFTHGWPVVFISLGTTVFFMVFYIWIYKILKEQFSCFIPKKISDNSVLATEIKGSVISLAKYGLTGERVNQIFKKTLIKMSHTFSMKKEEGLYRFIQTSYKKLSEEYGLSISLVKKEFSEIFKTFEVTKIEELKMLLLQYQVTE